MTVDMEKYEELLQQIGDISREHISRESLEELKDKYKSDIHSKRVLNEIVDISCLLKVLKKRAILKYNDPHSLRSIIEKYVREESVKQQIGVLIINYKQWLDENSDSINILYNSGKSNVLLTSHELNSPIRNSLRIPESLYLHNNFDKSLQTSTEDMTRESLLASETLNNFNRVQNENDTDRNAFLVINFKNFRLNISKKTTANVLIILILLFILIGIIWILIKIPRESAAVVPVGHSSMQAATGQPQLNMPYYMPTTRVAGYSMQSTFSVNHTQSYTASTVPPVNRDMELRNLVVNALSKKVGSDWKDVCRGLDLSENTIDEITIEYSREPAGNMYEKMFKKGLQLYFSEPQPTWESELRKALRLARRIDLEETVYNTMKKNSYR